MAKFKFQIWRRSITVETYWVEADSEDEAIEICNNGACGDPQMEFVDWLDDQYTVEDKECIDPLYRMVKEYDTTGT